MKRSFPFCMLAVALFAFPRLLLPEARAEAAQSAAVKPATPEDEALKQEVLAKEREGLEALKAGDVERFGRLTAEDALFIDSNGRATKVEVLKNVQGFKLLDFTIQDVAFRALSATSGLLLYRLDSRGVFQGKEVTTHNHVASIWAKRRGTWVCLFSQETAAS
jgi:hypothetical protein